VKDFEKIEFARQVIESNSVVTQEDMIQEAEKKMRKFIEQDQLGNFRG
jgi:hypothetical protein